MTTKEQLITNIKEWIKIDNEISKLRSEIRDKNKNKKILTDELIFIMKENDIDSFDINNGALIYKKNKIKKQINGKSLLKILKDYYKDDNNIAEELSKFIMDSREEKIKESIKLKISNKIEQIVTP